ncbi:hypothetical protein R1flu_025009 [Riccia fluitans]|uniref:Lon N-terminal domain-containing protein n=1 Tax=Riccia fluitans TaxID=41844 RepID=A0ABD1XWN1_9MARC
MNEGQVPEPPEDVRDDGRLQDGGEVSEIRAGTESDAEAGISTEELEMEEAIAGGGDGEGRREEEIRRAEGAERMQMQRIRELDLEHLEVEEVDSDGENLQSDDDSSVDGGRGDGGAGARGGFTFDTTLVSRHTYLGEVDDISQARSFLSGGDILTLPMFYLEGIVLFPDDTLPLRVLQPRFKAAVERAMRQTEAPCTLGVIHLRPRIRGSGVPMLSVGTTAEIRQLSRLEDGSLNVVTRGRQRFRIRKAWTEADGAPCAQVQIIEEDTPLHIPRDAFGSLAAVPSLQSGRVPRSAGGDAQEGSNDEGLLHLSSEGDYFDEDSDSGDEDRGLPFGLFGGDQVQWQREGDRGDESSEEEERLRWWWRLRRDGRNRRRREPRRENRTPSRSQEMAGSSPEPMDQGETSGTSNGAGPSNEKAKRDGAWGGACRAWAADEKKWLCRAQRTTWPHWVYRMYDAYDLARRAADMLRQIADLPKMDEMDMLGR